MNASPSSSPPSLLPRRRRRHGRDEVRPPAPGRARHRPEERDERRARRGDRRREDRRRRREHRPRRGLQGRGRLRPLRHPRPRRHARPRLRGHGREGLVRRRQQPLPRRLHAARRASRRWWTRAAPAGATSPTSRTASSTAPARASSPSSTSSATACGAGSYEQDLADMEAKPTAEMALQHKGLIVGIKTAHYEGPEWAPVERAVEAGTIADVPVLVDFGANKAERPLAELVTKKLRPGDIYAHMYSGLRGELTADGHVNPGHGRGPQARRPLRGRPRRRQLRVVRRGAAGQGGLPARRDLHRPAHRQHERGHEGPAQRHEQVPRPRPLARGRDREVHPEPRPHGEARGPGAPVGGRARRTWRC